MATKVTLKLLVDTKQNKVIFAEASKAAIDSLLNMFRLSFGTVVRLMSNKDMHFFGSLGNLYHTSTTIHNLNQNYVLFDPTIPNDDHNLGTSFDECTCDQCSRPMNRDQTSHVAMKDQNVTFMLMDDLVIQSFSPISVITLLNKFNFKQFDALQEMVVEFGMDECVELLKTSVQSKMVLTSVFIKNKNKKDFTMLRGIWYFPFVVFGYIVYFDCLLHSKITTSVTSLLVASLKSKVGLAIDFMRNNILDPKE